MNGSSDVIIVGKCPHLPTSHIHTRVQSAHFNPKTFNLIQKCHPYTGNLNRETSGDSKDVFLHCGDVVAITHAVCVQVSAWVDQVGSVGVVPAQLPQQQLQLTQSHRHACLWCVVSISCLMQ